MLNLRRVNEDLSHTLGQNFQATFSFRVLQGKYFRGTVIGFLKSIGFEGILTEERMAGEDKWKGGGGGGWDVRETFHDAHDL